MSAIVNVGASGGGMPSGPAGGDLGGTYPDPTVEQIHGVPYNADPLEQYTKLAGRIGVTNDTLLSLDDTGTLIGSADQKGLRLSSSTATMLGGIAGLTDTIYINDTVTEIDGAISSLTWGGEKSITFATLGGVTAWFQRNVGSRVIAGASDKWYIDGDGNFIFVGDYFHPEITNRTGVPRNLAAGLGGARFSPLITADDAVCTMGAVGAGTLCYEFSPEFKTIGAGTIDVTNPLVGFSAEMQSISGAVGSVAVKFYGYRHFTHTGGVFAGSIKEDVALHIEGDNGPVIDVNASVLSTQNAKQMRHAGPANFGSSNAVSNDSIVMELTGPVRALRVTVVNDPTVAIVTPLDGMIVFDSSTLKFRGYDGTSWVDFH